MVVEALNNKNVLVKIIRADADDYWRWFVYGFTLSGKKKNQFNTHNPRMHLRQVKLKECGKFGWRDNGVYEVGVDKRWTPKQKEYHSKHQSASLANSSRALWPALFGDGKRDLVGVAIDARDALLQRWFLYDGGTYGRPYRCFATRKGAEDNFQQKVPYTPKTNAIEMWLIK